MADNNTNTCNTAITINASTQSGKDPVPLFSAGESTMSCVMEVESLSTIDIQQAVFSLHTPTTASASYGDLKINKPVTKNSQQASSGTPYFTKGTTYVGRKSN